MTKIETVNDGDDTFWSVYDDGVGIGSVFAHEHPVIPDKNTFSVQYECNYFRWLENDGFATKAEAIAFLVIHHRNVRTTLEHLGRSQ